MFKNVSISIVLCLAGGVLTACGSTQEPPDAFTFNVTWKDEVTLIDQAHLGLLKESDRTQQQYTLEASGVDAEGLDLSVGRILIIHGTAFGKIASSSHNDNDFVVTLADAVLGDAILDGVMDWDFGIPFTADRVKIVDPNGSDGISTGLMIGSPQSFKLDDGFEGRNAATLSFKNGPFEYSIKIDLVDDKANLDVTMKKNLGERIVSTYSVKAQVDHLRAKGNLNVKDGELVNYSSGAEGLNGDLTLQINVAGSGNDLKYEFPVTVMKVPFLLGPIPASLNIVIRFVINATVPVDGSASMDAHVRYNSDMGFSYDGTKFAYQGKVGDYTIDSSSQPKVASSQQIGVNFGVGFPEIRLTIGSGVEASAWFRTGFLIGGSFTAYNSLIPVCLLSDAEFLGAAGYELSVFGFKSDLTSGSKTLFDEKKSLRRSGQCP